MRRRTSVQVMAAALALGMGVGGSVAGCADRRTDPLPDDAGASTGAVTAEADAALDPDAEVAADPGADPSTDGGTDVPRTEPGTVDQPYDYRELTDVDLADPAGAIERLQVPDDVLADMTSEALTWTVLDFPYFGNFAASSDVDGGVAFLAQQCNALEVLLGRTDVATAVQAVLDEFVASGLEESEEDGSIKVLLLELILADVRA